MHKPLMCQNQKEIEIIHADMLRYTDWNGRPYTILSGDVQLKQENMLMYCDSALIQRDSNTVDAYGHVHILQDTVDAWSEALFYDGNKKLARMTKNVRLASPSMTLYCQELFYRPDQNIAYYLTGGRVVRQQSTIT
ncbi:MAG: hypothetical protein NZ522_05605, partial [Chitinophagales bacterium]|nr:hypothetical protein [Chitinophagales bacterium]